MRQIANKPFASSALAPLLLVLAGLLLAISTNLAKAAASVGYSPLTFLAWSLAGACLLLTAVLGVKGLVMRMDGRILEYFLISGFLTTAASNLIFFTAVGHLGVGFVSLMMTLPPLLTYIGALALQMERFCWIRMMGVVLALVGSGALVLQRWAMPDAQLKWMLFTFVGPLLLSAGNLYRSQRWPPNVSAETLAPGMMTSALGMLILFSLLSGQSLDLGQYSLPGLGLIGAQAFTFAAQFLLLFALQRRGGPVLLSLMGGVSAVFSIPIAIVLFGETAGSELLVSGPLLLAGLLLLVRGSTQCRSLSAQPQIRG